MLKIKYQLQTNIDDTAIRILIADDHVAMRQLLFSLIQKQTDMEIIGEAENGKIALQMTRRFMPDVVIMDTIMPEMTGIEATRTIKTELPDIKVIAVSGHSDKRYVKAMTDAGASEYLLKERAFGDLADAVRRVMSN
ncbi:MAG: response regulator transcription factor [Bacteroidetes bacterium]|nr:MAG: response regulator transcription factor [Bacteroidota bacterium]